MWLFATKRYKLDEDKYKIYSLKRKGVPGNVMSEPSPELTEDKKLKQRSNAKFNKGVLPSGQAQIPYILLRVQTQGISLQVGPGFPARRRQNLATLAATWF